MPDVINKFRIDEYEFLNFDFRSLNAHRLSVQERYNYFLVYDHKLIARRGATLKHIRPLGSVRVTEHPAEYYRDFVQIITEAEFFIWLNDNGKSIKLIN